MEEARENERDGERKEAGTGEDGVRPLCREIFIHGCTLTMFLFSVTDHGVPFAVDGGLVPGAEGGGSKNVLSRSG